MQRITRKMYHDHALHVLIEKKKLDFQRPYFMLLGRGEYALLLDYVVVWTGRAVRTRVRTQEAKYVESWPNTTSA
jgi:hypothetical protein